MSKVIFCLVIIVLAIMIGPIIAIWALNALFPALAITLTFKTWFAMLVVSGIVYGPGIGSK